MTIIYRVVIITSGLLASGASVFAQFEQIAVNDVRPLYKAVEIMEARCACVITYEDPAYTQQHVVDWTTKIRRDGSTEPKIWIPPQMFFGFQYDLAAASEGRDAVARNIGFAIAQFNAARKDGVAFALIQSGDMFHVIPKAGSILDANIRPVIKRGTVFEVVQSIAASAAQAHGVQIGLGQNVSHHHQVVLKSESATVRELLAVALKSRQGKQLSWKLLYQLGHGYALNVVNP